MTRTLGFLATIMIVASVGAAAGNSLERRAGDRTASGRTLAAEVTGRQSFQPPNSISTSTSQSIDALLSQTSLLERASLPAGGETGGSGPNSTKRAGADGRETSAAPDSPASETTSPGDPAVQNVGEEPASPRGQLPQTSTILPLLGLIGLGSLVAGFFARR